jgi:hypothetical protein
LALSAMRQLRALSGRIESPPHSRRHAGESRHPYSRPAFMDTGFRRYDSQGRSAIHSVLVLLRRGGDATRADAQR